jgi:hypothetical protein
MNAKNIKIKQADTLLITIGDQLKALPVLPKEVKEFLVMITPWVSLIGGIVLAVLVGLFGIIGLIASPFAMMAGAGQSLVLLFVFLAIAIIEGVLMILAFRPTLKRDSNGWRMLAYTELLHVVSFVISIVTSLGAFSVFSVLWGILWIVIGFYLLFQIKSYYK